MKIISEPVQPNKKQFGFTMIEMIGVVFIIAVLIGILFPTINKVITKGKIARAQSEIEALSVALRMYESDLGNYPPGTASESDALHKYLGTSRSSAALNITVGPYMEFKSKDLISNVYQDPWRNPYIYTPAGPNHS